MTTKLKIKRANTPEATAVAPDRYMSVLPWEIYQHLALVYQAKLRTRARLWQAAQR